jgi:hypothetical protein
MSAVGAAQTTRSRLCVHLPKTPGDLIRSMSNSACSQQLESNLLERADEVRAVIQAIERCRQCAPAKNRMVTIPAGHQQSFHCPNVFRTRQPFEESNVICIPSSSPAGSWWYKRSSIVMASLSLLAPVRVRAKKFANVTGVVAISLAGGERTLSALGRSSPLVRIRVGLSHLDDGPGGDAGPHQTIGRVTDSHSGSRCSLGIASNRHHGDVVLLPKLLCRLCNSRCRLR